MKTLKPVQQFLFAFCLFFVFTSSVPTQNRNKNSSKTTTGKVQTEGTAMVFYTDQGKTQITEAGRAKLKESKDLLVKTTYSKEFSKYDKVIFTLREYLNSKSGKVEIECGNYLVEFMKKDIKSNVDISLWLMKPGKGEPSATIVNSDVEGRGDFMEWREQGQYAWFYITPKNVLSGNKKQEIIIVVTAKGYKQTGTKTKEYYDNDGKLVKETYPVYDDGTVLAKSNDFTIKTAE